MTKNTLKTTYVVITTSETLCEESLFFHLAKTFSEDMQGFLSSGFVCMCVS